MNRFGMLGIVFLTSASLLACGGSQEPKVAMANGAAGTASAYDEPVKLELAFQYMRDDDAPELDVYIETEPGSDQVQRVTNGVRDMDLPLFALAEPNIRDPYDPERMGPYPKGKALDITVGQYFEATGVGTYSCVDGAGTLDVQFEKLVPNGVYTIWHSFYAWPPTKPFTAYDLPLGARDGSQAGFTADENGSYHFQLSFKPCLQLTGEYLTSDISLAYHSDGKTYGTFPGEFGTVTHVQIYAPLPKRSGI